MDKEEMKDFLIKERNIARTTAATLPSNLYTRFRKKCLDLHIDYKKGLEQAMRLWLENVKNDN